MKLGIAVPWGIHCDPRFTETALNLRHPDGYEVKWKFGKGWCAANRHNVALRDLFKWGADLFCILGADQTYEPDMLCRLVERYRQGHEAVAAMVPMRGHVPGQGTKPFQPAAFKLKKDDGFIVLDGPIGPDDFEMIDPADGDIQTVHMIGSGVLMFTRDHLASMKEPWFFEVPDGGPAYHRAGCTDTPFVWRLQQEAEATVVVDTTIKVKHLQVFEIDETFTERFADWAESGVGDANLCDVRKPVDMGEIGQLRVSTSIPFFDGTMQKKYGLTKYQHRRRPAFFFGCYSEEDARAIKAHRGQAVIIWAGSDLPQFIEKGFPELLREERFAHVAISDFMAADLGSIGLPYKKLPFNIADPELFQPCPLGRKVYAYLPPTGDDKYGEALIARIKEAAPDLEFVTTAGIGDKPRNKMPDVYRECGVGLRLLEHDGLSNTVVELGMMGRPCLWNGGMFANAVPYDPNDIPGIVAVIRKHLDRDGACYIKRAEDVRAQDTMPDGWNKVSTYFSTLKLVNA